MQNKDLLQTALLESILELSNAQTQLTARILDELKKDTKETAHKETDKICKKQYAKLAILKKDINALSEKPKTTNKVASKGISKKKEK